MRQPWVVLDRATGDVLLRTSRLPVAAIKEGRIVYHDDVVGGVIILYQLPGSKPRKTVFRHYPTLPR